MCRIVSSCWILKCEYWILHSFFYWLDPECNSMNTFFCPLKEFLLKLRETSHTKKYRLHIFGVTISHMAHYNIYHIFYIPNITLCKEFVSSALQSSSFYWENWKSQFVWSSELQYTNPAVYRSSEFIHYILCEYNVIGTFLILTFLFE